MSDTAWSADNEEFKFDSLGEVLEYLYKNDELHVGRIVYFGTPSRPKPDSFIKADNILDMIGDNAYDFAGEYASDFPDVGEDAKRELGDFLSQWCNKHLDVTFYQMTRVQEYAIKAEDLADYPEVLAAKGHSL